MGYRTEVLDASRPLADIVADLTAIASRPLRPSQGRLASRYI
jgi:hypothetical protein